MKSIIEPNRVRQIEYETVFSAIRRPVVLLARLMAVSNRRRREAIRNSQAKDDSVGFARMIRQPRGASLAPRYHGAFVPLTSTGCIRSVAERSAISIAVAILSLSAELSPFALDRVVIQDSSVVTKADSEAVVRPRITLTNFQPH